MSVWFPIHRPRMGLSFSDRGLALVEVRRGRRQPSIVHWQERPLLEGIIKLSADEPNIKDREALLKELRAMLANTSERTLAVCLPDQACHLAVFPFEILPPRERDREPIVRYRFQHDEHVTLARDTDIIQRVFPVSASATPSPGNGGGGIPITAWVLAMAIRRTLLDEYRSVCEEVGLLPMSMSCASLWRFDFCQPLMQQASEVFFANCTAKALTFFAIRQGVPVFCRSKKCRRTPADILRELQSTVQYYDDFFPPIQGQPRAGAVPIYFLGDQPEKNPPVENDLAIITESVVGTDSAPWHLEVIRPDWGIRIKSESNRLQSEDGLSALACAMGL